jgi:hypothetical protein
MMRGYRKKSMCRFGAAKGANLKDHLHLPAFKVAHNVRAVRCANFNKWPPSTLI